MLESLRIIILILSIVSVYPGFTWSTACGGTYSDTDKGNIKSPGSPGRYRDHKFCNYAIRVASNKQVRMTFRDIKLITIENTLPEYVVLFDGPDCMAPRIHVIHYDATPTVVTSNNMLTALFVSDYQSGSEKFKADYEAVTGQEVTLPVTPNEDSLILDNCGGELNDTYGSLHFKGNGKRNALCIWRITFEKGNRVHIRFSEIKLDSPLAWLRVFDGNDCGAREVKFIPLGEAKVPLDLISTSNVMTIVYASAKGSENAQVDATYWDGTTTLEPRITAPLLPGDLKTDPQNVANNPAIRNTFDLVANSAGYLLAGAIFLILNMR